MFDFLQDLEQAHKILWYLAIGSSLVFVVQSILTFTGLDSGDGTAADFDSDLSGSDHPFQLFSFRNLINFLLGFSWAGIVFYPIFSSKLIVYSLAIITGILFVLIFFFLIGQVHKLAEDNTFSLESTIDHTAEVYLAIPENRSGKGKVHISIKGSFHELDAITDDVRIPTGSMVRIQKVESKNLLLVAKI
ncbi:NfeD family protein [Flavihumibacter solisilvae]|uniref:Serine protease n=1 Tax=Flavihumibacter solisilvae TaxID=1349421 RepID=A0A0C1IRV4_9BACT|nr:NfeD family protein [Flavihumibacter solisilvae]KIC93164.1 serine protease [Flavihumibacter solisilvae]